MVQQRTEQRRTLFTTTHLSNGNGHTTTTTTSNHSSTHSSFDKARPSSRGSSNGRPISPFKYNPKEDIAKKMGYSQGQWTPTKRRGPIAAEFQGPGPAAVALPSLIGSGKTDATKSKAPAFTLPGRPRDLNWNVEGPGPAGYDLTGLTQFGKVRYAGPFIHGRPKEQHGFVTPSPADYKKEKSDDATHGKSPKYTFGAKGKDAKAENIPAPNQYEIKGLLGLKVSEGSKKGAPSFTISGRTKTPSPPEIPGPGTYNDPDPDVFKTKNPVFTVSTRYDIPSDKSKIPGPGAYKTLDPDVVKSKSPAFTVSPRYDVPRDKTKVPGPGAFSPEKVRLDTNPHITFGIRHSPYIGSFPEKATN